MPSPTIDATSSGSATGGTACTFAHTVGATANLLLLGIGVGSSGNGADPLGTLTAVTYNGVAMTQVPDSAIDDNTYEGIAIWRLDNPPAGTHDVNITRTIGGDLGASAVSFIDASLTLKTPSTTTGTTTDPSLNVADTAAGDIVFGGVANDNHTSDQETAGGGTETGDLEDVGGDSDFNFQYKTASGVGTTLSFDLTPDAGGSAWVATGVAVTGTGGGGPTNQYVPGQAQRNRRHTGRFM